MIYKHNLIRLSVLLLILCIVSLSISGRGCPRRGRDTKIGSSDYEWPGINAPSGLIAVPVSWSQINLTWQDNSLNEDGFEVERKTRLSEWQQITATTVSSYFDTDLLPEVTYYYRVRAFNTIGDLTNWSNETHVMTFNLAWLPNAWKLLAPYWGHTIARGNDGTIWSWGLNGNGQLGLGDADNRLLPNPVGTDTDWNQIACGNYHTLALKEDNTLWSWGGNAVGQLGMGDTESENWEPFSVGTESDWEIVAAGEAHSFGLKTSGTLWAWGSNDYYQLGLGLGSTVGVNSPTQIGTDSDWYVPPNESNLPVLTTNRYHTLALKSNRTLWAWGRNNYGQLGLGDITQRTTPTQVGNDSDWFTVGAGEMYTSALKTDNTLWAWGNNWVGQLGIGNTPLQRNTPTQVGINSDYLMITVGGAHNIAVKFDGTIRTWGYNGYGQLGLGDNINRTTPTQIGTDYDWDLVAAGGNYTIALKNSGTIWVWGSNGMAQLGLGDMVNRNTPHPFGSPATPSPLTATLNSSTQIDLSWIDNSYNESGFEMERAVNSTETWQTLVRLEADVESYSDAGLGFAQYYYRIRSYNNLGYSPYSNEVTMDTLTLVPPSALTFTVIYPSQINLSWTDNSVNEDGFEIERNNNITGTGTWQLLIKVERDVTNYSDTGLERGWYYYRVRAYRNSDYTAYSNEVVPELRTSGGDSGLDKIQLVTALTTFSQIDLSWIEYFIDEEGVEIDRKTTMTGTWLTIVTLPQDFTSYSDTGLDRGRYYYRIRAYNNVCCSDYDYATPTLTAPSMLSGTAVSNNQINLSWSDNSNNEEGFSIERKVGINGTWGEINFVNTDVTTYSDTDGIFPGYTYYYRVRASHPLAESGYSNEIGIASAGTWASIAAGDAHTIARKTNGTIWSWGDNSSGQLGFGDTVNRNTPTQLGSGSDISVVTAGYQHSLAIKFNNTLWAWGWNDLGQLGLGDNTVRKTPAQIGTDSDWSFIGAGFAHTVAMRKNGDDQTIWSWGWNFSGQLGLGNKINRYTPTQIGTLTDIGMIAVGYNHTVALRTDGTIGACGENNLGQLGLGDTEERLVPCPIGTETDWSAVAAGTRHTLGLKTNQTLWAWGNNADGQLGLGDYGVGTERTIPTQVGSDSDWSNISAGEMHTIALKTNSTLWVWGYNGAGQLGLGLSGNGIPDKGEGDFNGRLVPTQLGFDSDWSSITVGTDYTFAIKTNGTLWAWGANDKGQLGLGDMYNRMNPTLISE